MFASTSQSATFFFITDATRSRNQSAPRPAPVAASATAPVRVTWVVA